MGVGGAQEETGAPSSGPAESRGGQETGGLRVPQGTTPGANRPQQAMAEGNGTFHTFLLVESE